MSLAKFGLVAMLASSPCFADTFKCDYNFKNGVSLSEVETSWLGIGFSLDSKKMIAARRWHNGWEDPRKITGVIKAPKFTTYKIEAKDKTTDGDEYNLTYSFRIYQYGRCSIRMSQSGYLDLKAEGTLKK